MASLAAERSALHGLAVPGHYGRAGATGLVIEERTDLALASVIAKRGKRFALVNAVNTAFGVALPDGPRRATRGAVTFAGTGPDQWIASAEGAEAAGFAAQAARAHRPVRGGVGSVRRAAGAAAFSGPRVRDVLAKGVPIDLHPKAFKPGDVAITLDRLHRRADRHAGRARPTSSPRRAAWRAASGRGSRHPPPSSAMTS